MRSIPPRLRNLLAMLASGERPLPVREAADRLKVSRRTVFRELANVASVLEPYGLEVSSMPGEGVTLEGPSPARNTLLDDLNKLERSDPADRRERRDKLILALLASPGQKLATHAERFKVSAPTISHDLDDIEPWLRERRLFLHRKPGTGIAVGGEEMPIRRAILTLMARMETPGIYPHPDILLDILDLAPELDPLLAWMTPQSREALTRYMAVMTQRVMDGYVLSTADGEAGEFATLAEQLAILLKETFTIAPAAAEIAALAVELASCRPNVPRKQAGGDDASLSALAAAMIARFDPDRAHVLAMDETLVAGLVAHLRTALVRIRHGIELSDPMREQIGKTYPDIIDRCRTACEALRQSGAPIPEDEVSLVAAHFGAALLRLAEPGAARRPVRVGVVCVHGIGSSYLLASQVKKAFGSRVAVEVGWHDDSDQWRRYDVLVSTTPLPDIGIPVIVAPAILGDDDIRRIDAALVLRHVDPLLQERAPAAFRDDLLRLEALFAAARDLIEHISLTATPAASGIRDMADAAGRLFGATPEAAAAIAAALTAREAISTQAVRELGIVLLHCRAAGIAGPRFGVMTPEGGAFAEAPFAELRAAVVMLLPDGAPRECGEMMGCLSAALIERERFLGAVQAGTSAVIREEATLVLREYLSRLTVQKLKG